MIKKLVIATVLLISPLGWAGGIPVVDFTSLSQMVSDNLARAQQWAKEARQWAEENKLSLEQVQQMNREYKHYKSMVEGHYTFEDVLNDPHLNNLTEMEGWRELYDQVDDLQSLREDFGLDKGDSSSDELIRKYSMLDKFYKRSTNRNKTLQGLLSEFQSADNPAKKSDLSNAISFEYAKIKNDEQMMSALLSLKEQKDDISHSVRSKRKIQKMFADGIPRN